MIFKEDILKKIGTDFPTEEKVVTKILTDSVSAGLNVGVDQFVRSLLFLSAGNIPKLKELIQNCDDPRDIVFEGEEESGNLNHWFTISFEEIKSLKGEKYIWIEEPEEISEDDNLPF